MLNEPAAVRRVGEMVARGASLQQVFVVLADEVSALLGELLVELIVYDDAGAQVVARSSSTVPVGSSVRSSADSAIDHVSRTGRAARTHAGGGGRVAHGAEASDTASTAAVPIVVDGRLRAALSASSMGPLLPAETDSHLVRFAELTALAITASESRERLLASRARIVAGADEARRRLQRDVHDGPQQRLVHAAIVLKMARATVEGGSQAVELVEEALANVERASRELRDIVQAILPRSLGYGGLSTGLRSLVADLSLPVDLNVVTPRLPTAVETTAYVVVAEAMTNAVKHSQARMVSLDVGLEGETLVVEIRDDGVGGADSGLGTGVISVFDRVDAAGGSLSIVSPPGRGTTVRAELPVRLGDGR